MENIIAAWAILDGRPSKRRHFALQMAQFHINVERDLPVEVQMLWKRLNSDNFVGGS